ncbi:MAG: type II toxin-antitoxin system PemK/MazF family toxin [Rivularia sp. ALOHA_DT_140]|nr:type II toxin-antitoxin system PemK/MazF family toxin [Rivularia sp. ALOHA_DT_140]
MAGKKPRQGWIYTINPHRVFLRCLLGHIHTYNLDKADYFKCKTGNCKQIINYNKEFRKEQPYIIWQSDKFRNNLNYIDTFTLIPLAFDIKEKYKGLPIIYPINPTKGNGFEKQSFALTHEIFTVDANCVKDTKGDWLNRIGKIDKSEKQAIEERLEYFLDIKKNPSDDWFIKNTSLEILREIFDNLAIDNQYSSLVDFIDDVEF